MITAKLEISDHGGHCSGNECEYELREIKKNVSFAQKI